MLVPRAADEADLNQLLNYTFCRELLGLDFILLTPSTMRLEATSPSRCTGGLNSNFTTESIKNWNEVSLHGEIHLAFETPC